MSFLIGRETVSIDRKPKKKKSRIFVNRGKKKRSKHNENYFYDMKCIQMIPEDLKELTHIYIYIYI